MLGFVGLPLETADRTESSGPSSHWRQAVRLCRADSLTAGDSPTGLGKMFQNKDDDNYREWGENDELFLTAMLKHFIQLYGSVGAKYNSCVQFWQPLERLCNLQYKGCSHKQASTLQNNNMIRSFNRSK